MARPQKGRRVCQLPKNRSFESTASVKEDNRKINLTVDEYEAIRLIDYVGCTQEECAKQMKVARSTVQGIYNDARRKIARFIIEATKLEIGGGNYELCERTCGKCNFSPCSNMGFRRNMVINSDKDMKIAVTYQDALVYQYFGSTEKFKVYNVVNGRIDSSKIVEPVGKGPGALANFIRDESISIVICGSIGSGAKNALAEAGIIILAGAMGDADKQVESFLAGSSLGDSCIPCSNCEKENKDFSCGFSCSM